jgi:phosphotriesterase-related protein
MARRGTWIEYDGIGEEEHDAEYISRILRMLDADLGDRILLSHDRGWYLRKPYTYIQEQFLPKLRAAGIAEKVIRRLTIDNPFRAFAR